MTASNERTVHGEQDLDERKTREDERCLLAVMESAEGRAFIWRVIDELSRVDGLSYTEQNPHHTSFMEGRRDLGLDVLRLAQEASTDLYLKMIAEAQERNILDMERRKRLRSITEE